MTSSISRAIRRPSALRASRRWLRLIRARARFAPTPSVQPDHTEHFFLGLIPFRGVFQSLESRRTCSRRIWAMLSARAGVSKTKASSPGVRGRERMAHHDTWARAGPAVGQSEAPLKFRFGTRGPASPDLERGIVREALAREGAASFPSKLNFEAGIIPNTSPRTRGCRPACVLRVDQVHDGLARRCAQGGRERQVPRSFA